MDYILPITISVSLFSSYGLAYFLGRRSGLLIAKDIYDRTGNL
jgi:hypothetical protein